MKMIIVETQPPPNFQAAAPAKHPRKGPSMLYLVSLFVGAQAAWEFDIIDDLDQQERDRRIVGGVPVQIRILLHR